MDAVIAPNQQEIPNFMKQLRERLIMLKKMDWRRLLFWKGQTKQDISQPEATTNESLDFVSLGIIHSAHKCPFTVFEDCIVDDNYSGLGVGSLDALQSAWLNIYSEYCTLIGDGASNARIIQVAKATAASAKISRVKALIVSAIETQSDTFLQCLRDSGYVINSIDDINRVISKVKTEEVRLGMLVKNMSKEDKGKKISREYFDDMFAAFADKDNLGVSVNKSDPSFMLSSYCALLRRMSKKQESTDRINNKHKR